MALEDEIKQNQFISEHQKAAINILFTGSWLHQINANFLKPFEITPEQFNVLRILRGSHPNKLMLAEVTARMLDKNSNCTRLVEKLRLKGLLTRTISQQNRRQVEIQITQKGLSLLKEIDSQEGLWPSLLKTLTAEEAKNLNYLLDKLRG